MPINEMLKQGIKDEEDSLDKAKQQSKERKEKAARKAAEEEAARKAAEEKAEEEARKAAEEEAARKAAEKGKHAGGRPTLQSTGKVARTQFSLTLKQEDYDTFLERAWAEDLSFSKFMEKAAKEYMKTHKTK